MFRSRDRLLSLVLAASLVLQGMMPALVYAHTGPVSEQQAETFGKFLKDIEASTVPGQPRGAHAPDRFLLLEQAVVSRNYVGRSFSFFSNAVERELEEHRSRIDRARKILRTVTALRNAQDEARNACVSYTGDSALSYESVEAAVVAHVNNGRLKDTPLFVWEAKNDAGRLACLEERVRSVIYEWNYKISNLNQVRDTLTEVPNVTLAPEKERNIFVNWWDVTVKVLDREDGSVVENLDLHKTADGHSIAGANAFGCANGDSCRFTLSSKGRALNQFHLPAQAIATLGPYLVFVHENSYDAEGGIQYLSFLDLSTYGASIGNSDIPVFRLPIVADAPVKSLKVESQNLVLDSGRKIPLEKFMLASEIQQVAFNISANLVDPDSLVTIVPYIDSLQTMMTKVMSDELADARGENAQIGQAKVLFETLGKNLINEVKADRRFADYASGLKLSPEELKGLPDVLQKALSSYSAGVNKSSVLGQRLTNVAKRVSNSRLMRTKLQSFFNRITSPVPNGSLKVKRALVMVGMARDVNRGGAFWRFLMDRPWLNSMIMVAGLTAAASPEAAMTIANEGLAIGAGIYDYLKFALVGIAEAASTGAAATFGPFVDLGSTISKQYIADGHLYKTAVGLAFFVPTILSIYFIPHLIFNLHKIFVDSRKPDWQGFVRHQREFMREYYQRLADDEAKRRQMTTENQREVAFTSEELTEIMDFVNDRRANSPAFQNPGFIGRSWRHTVQTFKKLKAAVSRSPAIQDQDQERVQGVWSAVLSVALSYPAMELTLSRWARFWNWFAGTRYTSFGFLTLRDLGLKYNLPIFVRAKPITTAVRLAYPDFFSTAVAQRGPKLTIPTELNGGMRGWGMRDLLWIKEALLGRSSAAMAQEEDVIRELNAAEFKELAENFESSVAETEDAVFKVAFNAGLKHLAEFVGDRKELLQIYTQQPLKSVVERRMMDLPIQVRTFLRLFFERVYQQTMTEYLSKTLEANGAWPEEMNGPEQASLKQLKAMTINLKARRANPSAPFTFHPEQAAQIAERVASSQSLYEETAKQARKGEFSLRNFALNRKYGVLADMDPEQNGSMKRFSTVQERMKSPNALSRAVRAEISKLLVTFPLNLSLKMLLAAGIFEGAFKPIQDEMLGPNSIFYLSRDSFYMMFASSFTIGMMADAWMKVQTDARQDEMGDFGLVPKGEDSENGFMRWYWKQFQAENNSLISNWAFSNRLSFWNMPAALVNMGLFYYLFSGRLDLSYLLGGYVMAFGTPASALGMKIDQAFERSSEYAARGIKDERWLAHPLVQEVVSKEKQYYRNRFQLLNDVFSNVVGNWLGNTEVVKTSYGTRGLMRAVFGGPLLEESIVKNLLVPLKTSTAAIPVVGSVASAVADACEHLLTNGNVDLNLRK